MSHSMSRPVSTFAAAAAGLAMAVLVLQYVIAVPDEDALREFLVVTGMIAVSTAIVFGLVIPRAVARGGSARIALTLSLLGLILAAAFWTGLPPVLAVGGIVLGQRSLQGEGTGLARAATTVGVVALLADLAAVVGDGIAGG